MNILPNKLFVSKWRKVNPVKLHNSDGITPIQYTTTTINILVEQLKQKINAKFKQIMSIILYSL